MEVAIRGLSLDYGGNVAVRNLDLDIAAGESVVLLGQSGCGKTSTMRCVAGLEVPNEGTIRIGERVVFDAATGRSVPAHRRKVGMVFQSYAVWPHRTVEENVMFPLRMAKVPKDEARRAAGEVLELVGLGHLAQRGASMLSGGQMQRVALARSIAMKPAVLLLDEPLSNLDARLRDDLRVELRRIQQEQNLTSIYVTHDQTEALALADRIAIMQGGKITQVSSPHELYSAPASASIASFLGVSNVFSAEDASAGTVKLAGKPMVLATGYAGKTTDHKVCIRPEAVQIRSAERGASKPDGANVLSGSVRAVSYQGVLTRMSVCLDGDVVIDSISPSQEIGAVRIGCSVWAHIPPVDVQVLPEDVETVAETPQPLAVVNGRRSA